MITILKDLFSKGPDKVLRASLTNLLGFRPNNLNLYRKAFTHSSAANLAKTRSEQKESYERLEFLGDAILSAVIADFLFKKFPYRDEGFLTKMRSRMVSRQQLGKLAVKFGIEQYIEAESGLQGKSHSINGDVFEALIGAIYLDKGYDFTARFIRDKILKLHLDVDEIEATDTDYKSKLIEWAQKNKKELRFNLVEEIIEGQQKFFVIEINIDGKIYSQSKHPSKKKAEQEAAGACLTQLGLS
ncbi:MAG: ribonuclease III [Bacteroidia bacterium]